MALSSDGDTSISRSPTPELVTPLTVYMSQTEPPRSRPAVRRRLPSHYDLEQACKANDIRSVRDIFANESLHGDYATNYILRVESLDMMRCLLEQGADASTYMRWNRLKSLDVVKLCVEFGYDVKAEGLKILQ